MDWKELSQIPVFSESQDVATAAQGETTIGDYALDIFRAPIGGISDALQGLVTLGVLPFDMLTDKDLTGKIDAFFDAAPILNLEAKTGLGQIVQTITQFGVPLGVASKIGRAIPLLQKAGQTTALSSLPTVGAKGVEIARRAGYWGALGGATDIAVSVPTKNVVLSDMLGITETPDLASATGKELAVEKMKQKLKFGAEGAVIGGGVAMLPVAGAVGKKLLGPVYNKVIDPAGRQVFRQLDSKILNPLTQVIAGTGKEGTFLTKGVTKLGKKKDLAKQTIYDKLDIPDPGQWAFFNTKGGTFGQAVAGKLSKIKEYFGSAGLMSKTLKNEGDKVTGKLEAITKKFNRKDEMINKKLYDIVSKFKRNIFDGVPDIKLLGKNVTNLKNINPGYRNITDELTRERNKITDYIITPDRKGAAEKLKLVNPAVRQEAKDIKQMLKESNMLVGNLFGNSPIKSFKTLAGLKMNDADNFFKQRLASFNNNKFKFDVDGPAAAGARKELKRTILLNQNMRPKNISFKEARTLKDKLAKGRKLNAKETEFNKLLDAEVKTRMQGLKSAVINAGANPVKYFNAIGRAIGKDVKKVDDVSDEIRNFLSTPKGQKEAINDFSPVLDTIIWNNKQVYQRQYFDLIEDQWMKNGLVFKNILTDDAAYQDVLRRGIDPTRLTKITARTNAGINSIDDFALDSKFFRNEKLRKPKEGQVAKADTYYTLPEIANAIQGVKSNFDNLFDVPIYSNLMKFKAGGQISKTIFSPMTQVRNVTTASFFPLASGLIGSRSSVSQAFRDIFEDIFQSGKFDPKMFDEWMDSSVTRGIIDQSIQVNEMKRLAERGVKGLLNVDDFMKNPTVKKFVDVYQGGDNIWKVYSDRFYQSALKQAFGDPKATPAKVLDQVREWYKTVAKEDFIEISSISGKQKTAQEAIEEVSAYLVTNTIPTYSKVPKAIQTLRDLPLGNFIAFPAEILRTGGNLITLGARELTSTNPYIRQMGARRLIGASATFGGIGTVIGGTAQAITGVTDEMMQKARSFVPQYEKNATLIPLSSPDADGVFKYFNFSYSNPYDFLVRPINAVVNAYGRRELNQDNAGTFVLNALIGDRQNPGALREFFAPFIAESIGTERFTDVSPILGRGGETASGKKIYRETDSDGEIWARSLEHIIGGLTPGAFSSAQKIWQGASGQFTDYGTGRDTRDEIVALMSGLRVQEIKPKQSMPFVISSYRKDEGNISQKFSSLAYSTNVSPERKVAAYQEWMKNSFISQRNLKNTINDALDLGVSTNEIRQILTDRLGNKNRVEALLRGRFVAPTPSQSRLESSIKRLQQENLNASLSYEIAMDLVNDTWQSLRRDNNGFDLDLGLEAFIESMNLSVSPDLFSLRELPAKASSLGVQETADTSAVLPVDPNKNTAINNQIVSASVPNRTTPGLFEKYFPRGIFN
jgi:hypothetical protein